MAGLNEPTKAMLTPLASIDGAIARSLTNKDRGRVAATKWPRAPAKDRAQQETRSVASDRVGGQASALTRPAHAAIRANPDACRLAKCISDASKSSCSREGPLLGDERDSCNTRRD